MDKQVFYKFRYKIIEFLYTHEYGHYRLLHNDTNRLIYNVSKIDIFKASLAMQIEADAYAAYTICKDYVIYWLETMKYTLENIKKNSFTKSDNIVEFINNRINEIDDRIKELKKLNI